MSADNRICIMEFRGNWFVWIGSCSQDYYIPPECSYRHVFDTEQEAFDAARKMAENITYLEGGITIIGREEQIAGLQDEIGYLSKRLAELRKRE